MALVIEITKDHWSMMLQNIYWEHDVSLSPLPLSEPCTTQQAISELLRTAKLQSSKWKTDGAAGGVL